MKNVVSRATRGLFGMVGATCTAVLTVYRSKYSGYSLGAPHRKDDVDHWKANLFEVITVEEKHDPPHVIRVKKASASAFQMIDRGVYRSQGVLQFNSIVFAAHSLLS